MRLGLRAFTGWLKLDCNRSLLSIRVDPVGEGIVPRSQRTGIPNPHQGSLDAASDPVLAEIRLAQSGGHWRSQLNADRIALRFISLGSDHLHAHLIANIDRPIWVKPDCKILSSLAVRRSRKWDRRRERGDCRRRGGSAGRVGLQG